MTEEHDSNQRIVSAIERARRTVNRLQPRTDEQRQMQQELAARLVTILMQAQQQEERMAPEGLMADIEVIRQEAIDCMKEMPAPEQVLLFSDCIDSANKNRAFTVLGQWNMRFNEHDSLTIPHGTTFCINAVARLIVILRFPNGIELRLHEENYPADGIPVQASEDDGERQTSSI